MIAVIVVVTAFLSPCDGNVQDICFDDAISAAGGELIYVPAGAYALTSNTSPARWLIDSDAVFINSDNWPNNIENTSQLTGQQTVIGDKWVIGGTDFEPYHNIRTSVTPKAAAEFSVVAENSGAVAAYATTGDKPFSQGNIGVQSYCLNSSHNRQNCYSGYFESNRAPWAGTTTTLEITTNNYGAWTPQHRVLPSGVYGDATGVTAGINISGAAGNGYYHEYYPVARIGAGIMFTAGVSGAGMDAGIVCTNAALANSTAKECVRMGAGQRIIWHGPGFNPYAGFEVTQKGEMTIIIWDGNDSLRYKFTKNGIILPSGKLLN